jgi:acetyl esterase/lipase
MASPEALAIKEQLRLLSETVGGAQSVEEQRAQYEIAASMMTAAPDGVAWTEVDAGGVPAIWADSEEGSSDHVVMYVHGGGYVIGSATGYRNFTGQLAKAVGCRVLNVDYRLAPEHPHPAAVDDSTTAYRWLLDQGFGMFGSGRLYKRRPASFARIGVKGKLGCDQYFAPYIGQGEIGEAGFIFEQT